MDAVRSQLEALLQERQREAEVISGTSQATASSASSPPRQPIRPSLQDTTGNSDECKDAIEAGCTPVFDKEF